MSYNTKNYTEQGGEKTVIRGTRDCPRRKIKLCWDRIQNRNTQTDSTATTIADLKADFNALLAKLKTAGLMQSE